MRPLAAALVGVTLAAPIAGPSAPPALTPVLLPRDHGAHPAYQVEWWYTAGTIGDRRAREYFWFATVWAGQGFVLARVNIVDLRADRVVLSREYVAPDALRAGQTTISAAGFTISWHAGGRWGRWSLDAPDSASWHWNWFACQFGNGSDLMLYQFYQFITPAGRPTGVQSGTFIGAHGAISHPRRYRVIPMAPLIHPPGAAGRYPLRWRLVVPSAGIEIKLAARARHQFIANKFIPGFWEGAAAITAGQPGACIVESTRETASGF